MQTKLILWAVALSLSILGIYSWNKHERAVGAAPYIQQLKDRDTAGKIAQDAANEKTRLDIASKRRIDDENTTSIADLHRTVKLLRDTRVSSDYLPPPSPTSSRPAEACFDRTKFERAVGSLDKGVQGLVDSGSEAIVNLNSAKRWANP